MNVRFSFTRFTCLLLGLLALLVLGGCVQSKSGNLKLAPISQLREDIRQQPLTVREAYQFALANPDVLSKIPCYCGCGEPHGAGNVSHKNVRDCFVREVNVDGTIVWDDMGLG
jgi:hypothetical protein